MNWINKVVQAYKDNEAPERFFYWAALATLSAAVKKNVYLERWHYHLWPNIYVFLVAKSGMKKSIPITMCKSLLTRANCTRIVFGRTSIQYVLKDFGHAYSLENGTVLHNAQGILLSGELAAFFVKDPDALTILTDLYDTHAYEKEWINTLKGTGQDKLKQPCVCLLGATNEDHFSEAVPPSAVGGGFIARTFIVFSSQRGMLNSLTEKPTNLANLDDLAKRVAEVAQLKGEFIWDNAAKKLYDSWYYPLMDQPRHDPTGTFNRIGDQVLKIAMLISMSESDSLMLEEKHIKEAINECMDCVNGVTQVTMGAGKSTLAYQTKLVVRELLDRPDHKIERQRLLQKFWGEFDAFDLDKIIETLMGAGMITVSQNGTKRSYTMPQDKVDMYLNIKRSIQ